MTNATEPATWAELIADCASIPIPRYAESPLTRPVRATPWQVDETCHAQVAELDAFV